MQPRHENAGSSFAPARTRLVRPKHYLPILLLGILIGCRTEFVPPDTLPVGRPPPVGVEAGILLAPDTVKPELILGAPVNGVLPAVPPGSEPGKDGGKTLIGVKFTPGNVPTPAPGSERGTTPEFRAAPLPGSEKFVAPGRIRGAPGSAPGKVRGVLAPPGRVKLRTVPPPPNC